MKNKLLSLCILVLLSCCLIGCDGKRNIQKQIDVLQDQLLKQEEQINILKNNHNQDSNLIEELKNINEGLENDIFELEIDLKLAKNEPFGKIFSLEEAYEKGFLSVNDLKSIAYYQNGGRKGNEDVLDVDYVPNLKDTLNAKTAKLIKETVAFDYRNLDKMPILEAKAEDITIVNYYGTYSFYAAVMLTDCFSMYSDTETTMTIANIRFYFNNSNNISIWKKV